MWYPSLTTMTEWRLMRRMISLAMASDSTVLSLSFSTMMASDGHAAADQVGAADAAFGEDRVAARAARGHDAGREFAVIELERVIEPRAQDGRRAAAILRGAQHQDHVGRLRFVARRLLLDAHATTYDERDEQDGHR